MLLKSHVFLFIRLVQALPPEHTLPHGCRNSLPRVGITTALLASFRNVSLFGKGPYETYPDRKSSAIVQVYNHILDELHTPYIVPGENGGRCDVRWLDLQNDRGIGVHFEATHVPETPRFHRPHFKTITASPYSQKQLGSTSHNHLLVDEKKVWLHMDHAHMGVGGDNSWTPAHLPKYFVKPKRYKFGVKVTPFVAATVH